MPTYRTLDQADLKGKKVLLRAGFDVPMENGNVVDITRIEAILKTMRFILDAGAVLILMAHQGRPKDGPDPQFSQQPLAPVLSKLLNTKVHFAADCIGKPAKEALAMAKPGEVVLLENLRFHKEEKKNDPAFAKELASLADVYVNDAFTNCHRVHASMVGVPKLLPSYMGFTLAEEVKHLSLVLEKPVHPLVLVISGAKMETKVPVIERFLSKGQDILLGGCIANTFIAAQGNQVGGSRFDQEGMDSAKKFMAESAKPGKAKIHVPTDVAAATALVETSEMVNTPADKVQAGMSIFDIGTDTAQHYCDVISNAKMIVWNGPLGVYEHDRFSHSSKRVTEAVAAATKKGAVSLIGGGDTIDFHIRYKYPLTDYTFVSMGGGAMLEFIAGKPFESLQVLEKK